MTAYEMRISDWSSDVCSSDLPLLIKGLLHPDDAREAAQLGVDGLIVSNHGGRQLDAAPAPLDMLPDIRAAVGEQMPLILDSGVRRGRSEARRVGKECGRPYRYRWSLDHYKKNTK